MLKVGITGGIGSGKSTVCQVFETLGIPVFYADQAAKHLTNTEPSIIAAMKALLGEDVYINGELNREKVAAVAFNNRGILEQMNEIIHPATIACGQKWLEQQTTPYAIKEAAIFFESGSNKDVDVMVGVSAPLEVRINRTMARDNVSREKVLERIARQMDDDEKMQLCDHVIINDGVTAIIPQVLKLHQILLSRAQ